MSVRLSFLVLALFGCGLGATLAQPPERPRDGVPPKRPADSPAKPADTAPAKPTDDGPKPLRPSDEAVPGLGPTGPAVKLHTGFMFTEGPAADKQGNLYFSDVPASRIHKIDLDGKLSLVAEKTNRANGLMLNAKGEIVACEGAGAVVAYSPDGKQRNVLVEKHLGKPFNSPNDLVLDSAGGVYFTDPHFAKPENAKQDKQGVYYLTSGGDVVRLIDDLVLPNGVVLSPDEKTLYVIATSQAAVKAYPVNVPGRIGAGRTFCILQKTGRTQGGGDGCTVDEKGNLYVATALGVQVFNAAGKLLGVIRLPETPSNVTFGGKDFKTLYATARTSVYAMPMSVKGHRFPASRS